MKIAIVEDDLAFQQLLNFYLKRFGKNNWKLFFFDTGESFLDCKETFNIIILDLILPDITGKQIVQEIGETSAEIAYLTAEPKFITKEDINNKNINAIFDKVIFTDKRNKEFIDWIFYAETKQERLFLENVIQKVYEIG